MVVEFSEYENMCNEIGSTFEKYGANINDMMEKYKELCKEKHQIHEKMKLQLGNLLKKRKLITDLSEQLR